MGACAFALLSAACSGGSKPKGDFTLSATTASFTAELGGGLPPSVTIAMQVTGDGVAQAGVAYHNGQSLPVWLGIDLTCSGRSCDLVLSIHSTALAPGRYESTFAVGTADANGKVLQAKDVTVTYTVTAPTATSLGAFTLSASEAAFTAVRDGTLPASVTLAVEVTGSGVASVATAPASGTGPSWLGTSVACTGATCDLVVDVHTTALLPGEYTSTFLVRTLGADGAVLRSKAVAVSYVVQPRIAIGGGAHVSSFTYGDTRTTEAVSLPVSAGSRTWTAAADVAWLQVPADAHTGDVALDLVVDASALAPGHYQGRVTATNAADALDTASLALTVDVAAPVLSVTPASIVLGGADGLSSDPQTLSFALDAGAAHPFTVEATTASGGSWLEASAATATVGTSPVQLVLGANRAGMVGGTYTGQVRVSVTVRDLVLTKDVPVTFNLEESRLVVETAGVGLSTSPARSVLSRSVGVLGSTGRTDVPWTATSDQTWLTVTASGTTGERLTLTADPQGLAAGTHFATVTVSSPDATVENVETIRVGLHVLAGAPASVSAAITARFSATSPVEPIVFLSAGGPDVLVYDVYSGQQVRVLAGVVAAAGAMAVSDDGTRLFVHDTTNMRVAEVDAVTGAFVRSYGATAVGGSGSVGRAVAYVRPAGHPTLVTPSSRAYELATGSEWPATGTRGLAAYSLARSPDQSSVVTDSGGVYRLKRTALGGGGLSTASVFWTGTTQGRVGQACISADGATAYTASGSPYNFPGVSMATHEVVQVLPGDAYPNAVVCVWNGIVLGGADAYYDATDVWAYDGPTGRELAKLSSSTATSYRSLVDRGLAVSADGTRLVTLSESSPGSNTAAEVRFQELPAPP